MEISVIIPVKNEPFIGEVIKGIKKEIKNCEIIIVDNSNDNSSKLAKKSGAKIKKQKNSGFGDACLMGAKIAKGKILAFIDGDGTYQPRDIKKLVNMINDGADYAIGNRLKNVHINNMSFVNIFGNKILSWLSNNMHKTSISDSQSGLRAITKKCFNSLDLSAKNFDFYTEMNIKAKNKDLIIKELPINYYPRIGKSKLKPFKHGLIILKAIFNHYS